jgi:hypothetical protein
VAAVEAFRANVEAERVNVDWPMVFKIPTMETVDADRVVVEAPTVLRMFVIASVDAPTASNLVVMVDRFTDACGTAPVRLARVTKPCFVNVDDRACSG